MKLLVGFVSLLVDLSIQDCTASYAAVQPRYTYPYVYQPIPYYLIYRGGQPVWIPYYYAPQYFFGRNNEWNPMHRNGVQPNLMPYPYTTQRPPSSNNEGNSDDKTVQNNHPNVNKSIVGNTNNRNDSQPEEEVIDPPHKNESNNNVHSNVGGTIIGATGNGNGGTTHNDAGVSVVKIEK